MPIERLSQAPNEEYVQLCFDYRLAEAGRPLGLPRLRVI